jgi:hypothetical protein
MRRLPVLVVAVLLASNSGAHAIFIVNDATNDISGAIGSQPHIDIASVQVLQDATNLIFKINLVGNPITTNWGKYMIGIDHTAGGDAAGNGWGRPIGMSTGMDAWIGSWVDFGGGSELRRWDTNTNSWYLYAASYNANLASPVVTSSSVTLAVPFSYLGLVAQQTIKFDVYTSGGGGGDGAVDALSTSNPSIGWWTDYYNTGNNFISYSIVPEPTTFLAWGLILATVGLVAKRFKSI